MRGFEVLKEYLPQARDLLAKHPEISSLIPQRATYRSSGYDLRSLFGAEVQPGAIQLIDTGLTAYMQDDEELQIRCRSGFAIKGILVANGVGTIDSDYYGKHIKVLLYNTTDKVFSIQPGDRIAQGVFCKYLITDNDRPAKVERTGGFGSTGVN